MSTMIPRVQPGAIKPRKHGWAALADHRTFRRLTQLAAAGFIAVLAVQHSWPGADEAAAASPEAFCPFGGVETLYQYVTGGGSFVAHTHLSNLVVLAAVLVTALLLRSAFCGWICPFGFLQDLLHGASTALQKRIKPVRRAVRWLKTRGAGLAWLDRPLRWVKYGVLAWAVGGAAVYGVMVFRDYDPWAALLSLGEWSLGPGVVVLGVVGLASLFVERPWCRYACPLGAASGLVSRFSPVRLQRDSTACKACAVCSKACPMGLSIHDAASIQSVDCIGCLECVGACPREGALAVTIGWANHPK